MKNSTNKFEINGQELSLYFINDNYRITPNNIHQAPETIEQYNLQALTTNIITKMSSNVYVLCENGFCIQIGNKNYYVGYVEGEDDSKMYKFNQKSPEQIREYYYLDLNALVPDKRISFKKAIKVYKTQYKPTNPNEILLINTYSFNIGYDGIFANLFTKADERFNQPLLYPNNGYFNLKQYNDDFTMNQNGFTLLINNMTYYIGYVEGEDDSQEYVFSSGGSFKRVYYINLEELNTIGTINSFKKSIYYENNTNNIQNGIVLCSFYSNVMSNEIGLFKHQYTLQLIEQQPDYNHVNTFISFNNNTYPIDYINENQEICINENGFSIFSNGKIYYIGYVEGEDETQKCIIKSKPLSTRTFVLIDKSKLIETKRVSFKKALVYLYDDDITYNDRYFLLCEYYMNTIIHTGLLGPVITDYLINNKTNNTIDNTNDILFRPQYYSYLYGRINNEYGDGKSWYRRFTVSHASDVHQQTKCFKEHIQVSNQCEVDVILNCGDFTNGIPNTETENVLNQLTTTLEPINQNTIPMILSKGNHDVSNLTQQQQYNIYLEKMHSGYVYGDQTGYRLYGYSDINSSAMGTFRIINLDPFDYDDGQFNEIYPFQSAVFSQKQIDWLISTLKDAVNNNYNIITMMHYSFGDATRYNSEYAKPDAAFMQSVWMIPDIIDAIRNKTSINETYNDTKGINNITINEDFSTLTNDMKYICHFFGHIHSKNHYVLKKSDGSKNYNINMFGEAALGEDGNALNKAYCYHGTINQIAFSTFSIDTIEKKIYRVSYGRFLNYDHSNDITDRTEVFEYI